VKDQAAGLRARGRAASPPLAPARRVVSVTGGKGGIGKSTMALNLAAEWARRGASVVALDGDAGMADLNILLGVAPTRSLRDFFQGVPLDEILVEAHGIHLLPAFNGSYHLANLAEAERDRMLTAVAELARRFDTLMIDTPAGIGAHAMSLAGAAADVILVATPEPLSLADAYACLKVLATRQNVRRAFVLPNQVRSPTEAEEVHGRLQALSDRFLGVELTALPAVPHDDTIRAAASAGVPLVLYSPDAPAARAIARAARQLDGLAGSRAGAGAGPLASFLNGGAHESV
jgi:flagellar biosynthesis protein FlhG